MAVPALSRISQQLFEVEVCHHLDAKNEKNLYVCAQTLFAQISRVGFLVSGGKKNLAVAACVIASNNKIYLRKGVNQALDLFEIANAVHSLFFFNTFYGASFLVLRCICHIADSPLGDPTAEKIKLFFVGYFSAFSKLLYAQSCEFLIRVVNMLFFAKIVIDCQKIRDPEIIDLVEIKEPRIKTEKLFSLPLTGSFNNLQTLVQKRLHEVVKNTFASNAIFNFSYHINGGDCDPGLIDLKMASFKVISTDIHCYCSDPYIVGKSLREKYNFISGYLFTRYKYLNKVTDGIIAPQRSTYWLMQLLKKPYAYLCHLVFCMHVLLEGYFLDGSFEKFCVATKDICLALFCLKEYNPHFYPLEPLTVDELVKASGKDQKYLQRAGVLY